MFSPSEDQSRPSRKWRAAVRNAAELVVAFATLDSYPLNGAPHDSFDDPDAPSGGEAVVTAPGDPHGRHERVLPAARRRGHGSIVARPLVCLHGGSAASLAPAEVRTTPDRSLTNHA